MKTSTAALQGAVASCLLTLVLASCGGGGGGGGGEPAANNLSASALAVVTPDPRIGYPLTVSVTINAERAADDVSVSLFAVDRDQPPADTRQLPLGTQIIPRVEAGENSYEIELNVPTGVELPRSYHIAAIVNPVNVLPEADVDDNVASTVATLAAADSPNVFILEAVPDSSVLQLDMTSYEDQLQPVAGEVNVHNADAGATLFLGAEGVEVPLEAQVFAKLRMTRLDRNTSHDVPLYLWDSQAGRYTNAFGVLPDVPCDPISGCLFGAAGPGEWLPIGQIEPQSIETVSEEVTVRDVDRASVHLDLYFPGKLAVELQNALRHLNVLLTNPQFPPPDLSPEAIRDIRSFLSNLPGPFEDAAAVPQAMSAMAFALCVAIRPADPAVVDRFAEDNEICSPVSILLPPLPPRPPDPVVLPVPPVYSNQTRPVFFDSRYKRDWGGKMFGYGIDFNASVSADERGLIGELHGAVPVRAFGLAAGNFVAADLRAQAVPEYDGKPAGQSEGLTLELYFANELLLREVVPPGGASPTPVSFSKELGATPKTLIPGKCRVVFPPPNPPEKDCPAGQSKDYRKLFFVGPVPVLVTGKVIGNLGVELGGQFAAGDAGMSFSAAPFVNAEGKADATVDIGVLGARIEGTLRLLDERFRMSAGATLGLVDDGFLSGQAQFVIQPYQQVVNELSGLSGKLTAYARYSVPTLVRCSWGFVTGVCPRLRVIEKPFELESWKAPFLQRDVLYDRRDNIAVVVAPGMPVTYYRQ